MLWITYLLPEGSPLIPHCRARATSEVQPKRGCDCCPDRRNTRCSADPLQCSPQSQRKIQSPARSYYHHGSHHKKSEAHPLPRSDHPAKCSTWMLKPLHDQVLSVLNFEEPCRIRFGPVRSEFFCQPAYFVNGAGSSPLYTNTSYSMRFIMFHRVFSTPAKSTIWAQLWRVGHSKQLVTELDKQRFSSLLHPEPSSSAQRHCSEISGGTKGYCALASSETASRVRCPRCLAVIFEPNWEDGHVLNHGTTNKRL